jgi:hypothetical protein
VNVTDADQEHLDLREMAEELDKELTLTQQLLKIARLYHRSTWQGERDAAAEAFARVALGTPWEGLSPEQFLRSARRPTPDPDAGRQPEPETEAQPQFEQTTEHRHDQREAANKWWKLSQKPGERIGFGLFAVFIIAGGVGVAAGLTWAPARNPSRPAGQTSSSGPQTNAALSDAFAAFAQKSDVAVVEPERPAAIQVDTPIAPRPVTTSAVSPPAPPQDSPTPRPVTTSAVSPPARPQDSPTPLTAERQAEFIVQYLLRAGNAGDIGSLGTYYSDTIGYYGKRMGKLDVIADKVRSIERWKNRNYVIRPDTLTINCSVLDHGSGRISCDVKGLMDWEVTNSSWRSSGTASFTYTLEGRSDPLDLRIASENSTVITKNVAPFGRGQ